MPTEASIPFSGTFSICNDFRAQNCVFLNDSFSTWDLRTTATHTRTIVLMSEAPALLASLLTALESHDDASLRFIHQKLDSISKLAQHELHSRTVAEQKEPARRASAVEPAITALLRAADREHNIVIDAMHKDVLWSTEGGEAAASRASAGTTFPSFSDAVHSLDSMLGTSKFPSLPFDSGYISPLVSGTTGRPSSYGTGSSSSLAAIAVAASLAEPAASVTVARCDAPIPAKLEGCSLLVSKIASVASFACRMRCVSTEF